MVFNPEIILILGSNAENSGSFIKELLRKDRNADGSFRKCLPPPPDIRRVVLQENSTVTHQMAQVKNHGQILNTVAEIVNLLQNKEERDMMQPIPTMNTAKEVISKANTTIIGDYVVGCFHKNDSKWLVQVKGNATLQSLLWDAQHDAVIVNKRYIFIIIGHNQLWTFTKGVVVDLLSQLIEEIRM